MNTNWIETVKNSFEFAQRSTEWCNFMNMNGFWGVQNGFLLTKTNEERKGERGRDRADPLS